MYMRKNRYARYSLDGLPPNYSGQFTEETIKNTHINSEKKDEPVKSDDSERLHNIQHEKKEEDHKERDKDRDEIKEKRDGSLLGNLFGKDKDKDKDGKKGGLLSGLLNFGDKDKDGGFLSNIELEDLILLAVIFFLLKDGIEDDIIIILAIILFSA